MSTTMAYYYPSMHYIVPLQISTVCFRYQFKSTRVCHQICSTSSFVYTYGNEKYYQIIFGIPLGFPMPYHIFARPITN